MKHGSILGAFNPNMQTQVDQMDGLVNNAKTVNADYSARKKAMS